MLLKKRVKAGILLYALFLLAIFALLLQFYLNRLQSNQLLLSYQQEQLQAQLMAELTKQEADQEVGGFSFDKGQSRYRYSSKGLVVEVELFSGDSYHYQFAKFLPEEKEEDKPEPEIDNLSEEEPEEKEEEVREETDDYAVEVVETDESEDNTEIEEEETDEEPLEDGEENEEMEFLDDLSI
jgi:hypothetical protein